MLSTLPLTNHKEPQTLYSRSLQVTKACVNYVGTPLPLHFFFDTTF